MLCGGLPDATQTLLFSFSTVQIRWKCSSGELKSHTNHHPRQTRLDLGKTNWIYHQLKYIGKARNRDKTTSLRCHTFGTSKNKNGCVTLSVRIVFIHLNLLQNCFSQRSSSPGTACAQGFLQGWSRMPWVCLALTSPAQSMLLAQLLGKIFSKKGLQQCRKPLSLESQDCIIISKIEFFISQYSWETAMGKGRREGTIVHSKFSCPFCHHNLESLETDFCCC